MRLKLGFILRSVLVIGTFLGLVVLWSSLSPKPSDETPFGKRADILLPKGDPADQFKPVVPWPHVEGVEVDLNSIRLKHGGANPPQNPDQPSNQKQVIQQQYVTFRPHTHSYTSPILKKGILGNFEPKEPEPPGVPGGPGEGAKPFVLGPEYKDSVQASIKEFGFNMVASDMISLDRTISDIRHEECKYWHYDEKLLTSSVVIVFHNEGWSTLMRTVHSVIKRTPRKFLAEIVLIDDYSNKDKLLYRQYGTHQRGGTVEIGPGQDGGNQLFRINEANQLMQYDQCLTRGDNSAVIITHCDQNQHTEWKYFKDLHRFTHVPTGKCLDRSDLLHKVFISDCDTSKTTQKWEMNNIVAV
ncbi:N-acetylgalactosaminyltransferase 7 isoform X1 [Lates japonicus]|uniref:Protein-UDP acetylgalactosaminyltransferase 7 n=1 Tax=Lates japonicus TaxID=270547 RepID=A0AAD3R182_LATJO|nr:N-acetylgalactosaminyltransferase 7 isoform X1 [Lates japonicus]